jgi:thiol-disulfide isomerase/thioredoxin
VARSTWSRRRRWPAFALAALLGGVTGAAVAKELAPKVPPKAVPEPAPASADLAAVLAAVREPGASAVLVNVWATWCDPCREEMPEIVRFYRDHQPGGLRLVLVSADDPESGREVARFLAKVGAVGARAFIKTGDDMAFINGLDARWTGALPASFLFDGQGQERHFWPGQVTYRDLETRLAEMVGPRGGATNHDARDGDATNKKTRGHP